MNDLLSWSVQLFTYVAQSGNRPRFITRPTGEFKVQPLGVRVFLFKVLLQRPVWLRARGGSERSAAPRCWAGLPADVFAIIMKRRSFGP